jgi:hypothetical protein
MRQRNNRTSLTSTQNKNQRGKGAKDRVTMLSESLREPLQKHLAGTQKLHQRDLEESFGSVSLPSGLARKYPNAEREWGWQWVFPSANRSLATASLLVLSERRISLLRTRIRAK